MRHLSFALLLLAGCPTTALYSTAVDGLWLQRVYGLNTEQKCLDAPELLRCAEKIGVALADSLVKAGKYPTRAEVFRRWGHPGVCLVARWEPCRLGSLCAPASTEALRCAPRAGCTIENSSWISRTDDEGRPYDYSDTLETELRVSMGNRLGIAVSPRHDTPWESVRTGIRCAGVGL